jgi:hypothetical protein
MCILQSNEKRNELEKKQIQLLQLKRVDGFNFIINDSDFHATKYHKNELNCVV